MQHATTALFCFLSVASLPGCNDDEPEVHPHADGDFGGVIVPVGRDHYHAEVLFVTGGEMRIYMRDHDEVKVVDIEKQHLKVYVRGKGLTEATEVILEADPQPGDKEGRTSQFFGQLPDNFGSRQLLVTVPEITINGERYRFHFMTEEPDSAHPTMPPKVKDSAEKKLYLTAKGAYTDADIKANGSKTASVKYADFQSNHNLHPQPGDRLCPITKTRASKDCTWIVAGETYHFCCPPCIDEFVKKARENPEALPKPDSLIKKADAVDSTSSAQW